MRMIFAIWFLQISSSLGSVTLTDVLSETDFKNIISDGKWHVLFRIDKSLDAKAEAALSTEFQFFGGFPYVCRIKRRCVERLKTTRTGDITALITMDGAGTLNFDVYKIDTGEDKNRSLLVSVETYSYAVYKYEPKRLLILYTCTRYGPNVQYGLLILHNADAKGSLGRKIEMDSLLAAVKFGGISANETVYLDHRLSCSYQFLDLFYKRNGGEKNPQGNWWFGLANLVLGDILLQIYKH